MSTVLVAFLLALFAGVTIVVGSLAVNCWGALLYGLIAGIVVGDINLGLQVGAICTLMSVGFYTYGGATIPDFSIGSIFGVFVAKTTLAANGVTSSIGVAEAQLQEAVNNGLVIATAIAMLMTLFDILGRGSTTVFQHGGDRALAKRNIKSYERWHLAGVLPWALSRAIPVFIGMLFIGQSDQLVAAVQQLDWLQNGLRVVGAALPAVGFALLLSYMEMATYWPYMIVGYVLFAYLKVPTVGLALVGIAAAAIYMKNRKLAAQGGR